MARGETYDEFTEKFKLKKTTDDCYTPPLVYEAVKNWAVEEYGLQGLEIVRPFYPGSDYQNFDYPKNCIVIDNPPFSIMSEIKKFYVDHEIRFFLFAPVLTLFTSYADGVNYIITKQTVTYGNGAKVGTAFVTSEGDDFIRTAPELNTALKEAVALSRKEMTKTHPKYQYPANVISSALLKKIAGVDFRLKRTDCSPDLVRVLDSQRASKKTIYGNGYFISNKKAAELKAAELKAAELKAAEHAAVWELSDREKAIIAKLGEE